MAEELICLKKLQPLNSHKNSADVFKINKLEWSFFAKKVGIKQKNSIFEDFEVGYRIPDTQRFGSGKLQESLESSLVDCFRIFEIQARCKPSSFGPQQPMEE